MTEQQKPRVAAFTTNFKPLKEFYEAESYPCKFDYQCKKEGKFKPKKYKCMHGGGVGCYTWRLKTNREISLRSLPGRCVILCPLLCSKFTRCANAKISCDKCLNFSEFTEKNNACLVY